MSRARMRQRGGGDDCRASAKRVSLDVTHIPAGADDWAHLAAVIDRHEREIIGYEFALRGRAREVERALEEACFVRCGTVRQAGPTPVVRSDNGLAFQGRRFHQACHDYRLSQEYLTDGLHVRVERTHQAFPQEPKSTRPVPQVRVLCRREGVDRMVQPRPAA